MIRGKVLLWTLLILGALTAILGIAQMWAHLMDWPDFLKSIVTLLILGTLAGFLIAVDYDFPSHRGKIMLSVAILLGIVMAALIIGQMWWSVFELMTFGKILTTDAILLVLVSFFMAVKEDLGNNKSLKDDKYLD